MVIHKSGSSAYVLYLDNNDIHNLNLDPENISSEEAVDILCKNCPSFKLDLFTKAHIELFSGKHDLIMFIHINISQPMLFEFNDIESIIDAIANISSDAASSLLYYNDRYLLVIWPIDKSYCSLFEYGTPLNVSPNYFLHIFEHCKFLISNNAIYELKKFFPVYK